MNSLSCKAAVVLVVATIIFCNVSPGAEALGGRKLLGNPDLPSQRGDTPAWLSPSGSSQQSQAQAQSQSQAQAQSQSGGASSTEVVFSGGQFGAGWHDSSYNARPFTSSAPAGKDSGTAWCNYLPKDAATSFWGPQGAFSGRRALEFWAYAGDQGVADLDLLLYGASANACSRVALSELSVVESSGGWVKYWVDLYRFSWEQQGGGGGGGSPSFSGCGSSGTSAGELVKLDLLNLRHPEYEALLCIDNVRLVA